ncbi:MAG: ATP-binding protein [Promethearchaeota archaeon]
MEEILSPPLIDRDLASRCKEALDTSLVKVIIGPRRAGKTILSLQAVKDEEYYYVNFDDEVLGNLRPEDLNGLLEILAEQLGSRRLLVLDEVQNVPGWELFVNRLSRGGYNVILTGSNSKLLSHELSTHLTGRTITLELLPFSFREYLWARGGMPEGIRVTEVTGLIRGLLHDYMTEGGFPEVVTRLPSEFLKRRYLKELFEASLTRDVIQRHNIKYASELVGVANSIINNFSRRSSLRKLSRDTGVGVHTLKKYVEYISGAYMLFQAKKFSFKPREVESSIRKYYATDLGYIKAKGLTGARNLGFLMENLVAIELRRRGHELYYYLAGGRNEVDFVVTGASGVKKVIQVCYDEAGLPEREVKTGVMAARELRCRDLLVVTWIGEGEEVVDGVRVNHVPLWKWLLPSGS